MRNLAILALTVATVAFVWQSCSNPTHSDEMEEMTYAIPAGSAFADGISVRFAHTEVSDSATAVLLSNMMNSPVLHVPSLAQVPEALLAKVYVFSNGLKGDGPLGFQGDVFDKAPPSADYTPLRQLHIVAWKDGVTPRLLMSSASVEDAATAGDLAITKASVVINMPFIAWQGDAR